MLWLGGRGACLLGRAAVVKLDRLGSPAITTAHVYFLHNPLVLYSELACVIDADGHDPVCVPTGDAQFRASCGLGYGFSCLLAMRFEASRRVYMATR